jgi:alkyl sulfatase BDS1-like metallo-beta-lactamase superfamily hydrolase
MAEKDYEQRYTASLAGRGIEEECAPGIFRLGISNTSIVLTDEGVVVIDVPIGNRAGKRAVDAIRKHTHKPVYAIIYTHGHMDHVWSVPPFLADAQEHKYAPPHIVGHENVARRFDRYQRLKGQHEFINTIQFAVPGGEPILPQQFYYPDWTFSDSMQFRYGGLTFEIHHFLGETDDSLWVWVPERKTALIGDMLITGIPNVGNPFKVQRYTREWAAALERVAGMNADFVVAAGQIFERDFGREVLLDTARCLNFIEDEVVKLLNEGCWIEEIIDRVKLPADLASKPWLAPLYGHPTFVIYGVHRRYAGWYNGNPGELFPAPSREIAARVVKLAGTDRLLAEAKALNAAGGIENVQLALHMVDFVVKGSDSAAVRKEALRLKSDLLKARADAEPSYIARNIFRAGSTLARREAGVEPESPPSEARPH